MFLITEKETNGYIIEIALLRDALRITGDDDGYFGFDFQINDADGVSRETMLRWHRNDNHSWHWANVFGNATFSNFPSLEISETDNVIIYPLSDLIIRPKNIFLSISRTDQFRNSEINVMNWLLERNLLVYVYLKKPVNNLEIGYIHKIDIKIQNSKIDLPKDKNNRNVILLKNIFGKETLIPYKEIEIIIFDFSSAVFQLKSETSLTSRLGFKILKKFKPERIIIP